MRLYHGSTEAILHPSVNHGRDKLDFGKGFYLTNLLQQASDWARTQAVIRAVDSACVNVYEFDIDKAIASGARLLTMPNYDKAWLDFIVASRKGGKPWNGYDIVEGGVANDRVIKTVDKYIDGKCSVAEAIDQLMYAKTTHQLCILSQVVVDKYLIFKECKHI